MPGRTFNPTTYRYGFNGKESDFEIKNSAGSSYDFGARIYDPRLGKWLSTDPLQAKYPDLSPYNFTANNPIVFVDPNGKEIIIYYGNNQTYTYGSKEPIPNNEFVQQTVNTLNGMVSGKADPYEVVKTLSEDRGFKWVIDQTDVNAGGNVNTVPFPESNGAITGWDHTAGIKSSGGKQSPATQLRHEAGHAYIAYRLSLIFRHAVAEQKNAKTDVEKQGILDKSSKFANIIRQTLNYQLANWDNVEEKMVNDKMVNPSIQGTEEVKRFSHEGTFFTTDSPTSIEESNFSAEPKTGAPYENAP